ncbi:MAG: histidine phosphatase family protein [Pirellulales bacterium]|nr:histidine phosphatase family protein [Pirellulales bacterium]
MILYLMRHAWAGDFGDPRYPDDRQRPLTAEGRKRFIRWLNYLEPADIRPRVIFTSPYVRCRQTADLLAEWLADTHKYSATVISIDELGCGARPRDVWTTTQGHPANALAEDQAWVGHMPDMSSMCGAWLGLSGGGLHFTKGAIAAIRCDPPPQLGQGELLWLASPKMADV